MHAVTITATDLRRANFNEYPEKVTVRSDGAILYWIYPQGDRWPPRRLEGFWAYGPKHSLLRDRCPDPGEYRVEVRW